MTGSDVRHLFETLHIRASVYSIGAEVDDDVYCLFQGGDGKWGVSYWERGEVVIRSEFGDETTACEALIALVLTSYSSQVAFRQRLRELVGPTKGAAPGLYP